MRRRFSGCSVSNGVKHTALRGVARGLAGARTGRAARFTIRLIRPRSLYTGPQLRNIRARPIAGRIDIRHGACFRSRTLQKIPAGLRAVNPEGLRIRSLPKTEK